jgi:hypothetical protein
MKIGAYGRKRLELLLIVDPPVIRLALINNECAPKQIHDLRVRIAWFAIRRQAQMVVQESNGPLRSKEDDSGGNVRRKSTTNVNPHRDSYCHGHCVRVYDGRLLDESVVIRAD